jgi:adenine-specific DNA glycosylase
MSLDNDLPGLRASLLELGQEHDGLYPWHTVRDPFHLLVAEYFLRRTTWTVVARVFPRVVGKYPTAESLVQADPEELCKIARQAGLRQQTLKLIQVAQEITNKGSLCPDRDALLGLLSVGPYISDAELPYGFKVLAFALDSSVQRVLRPLSVKECARVQTFPDNWVFYGSLISKYRQIGNATPVKLAALVGKGLYESVCEVTTQVQDVLEKKTALSPLVLSKSFSSS